MRHRLLAATCALVLPLLTSCDPSKIAKLTTSIADLEVSGPLVCGLHTTKGPDGRDILALHCVSGGPMVRDFLKKRPIVTAP